MNGRLIIVLTALVSTLAVSQARADTRVTVHDFYGPNSSRVREDVVNLLERQSGITIVSKGQIEDAAKKLGVDPYSPDGRKALSRELNLSAWMTGLVQKRSGKLTLTVVVYDGAKHSRVGRAKLIGRSASNLSAEISRQLWQKSRGAIMRASAPDAAADNISDGTATARAETTSARDSESPLRDKAAATSDSTEHKGQGESLRAFIGIGSPYRSLAYNQPVTTSLGNYQLSGTPMADLNIAFHPARLATDGWASWFGVDLRAQIAFTSPTTTDRTGSQFKSRYDAFHLGLRARIPVGDHYVSAFSGYGMNKFSITSDRAAAATPAPSVDYRIIRSGLGAEFALTDSMMLGADAAWLNYLSVGNIGQWFPRATAGGLELGVFATYRVTDAFFARAAAAYQRTFFDFNSRPGDKYIAGGATDQYLAVSLGAGVQL